MRRKLDPIIEGCTPGVIPLTYAPLGSRPLLQEPPLPKQIQLGRKVTFFAPPPFFGPPPTFSPSPSFAPKLWFTTGGCSATVAPEYQLVARKINPNGPDNPWFQVTAWSSDDSMEWTPLSSATYQLEVRMRSTGGSAAEAVTAQVNLRAVASLAGAPLACTGSRIVLAQAPPGRLAIQLGALFDCNYSLDQLEYKIQARKAATNDAWSVLHDWSPERVFYWRLGLQAIELQILYRRQGSNVAFEGATPPKTYPVFAPPVP